jgi:hypothetical protein
MLQLAFAYTCQLFDLFLSEGGNNTIIFRHTALLSS